MSIKGDSEEEQCLAHVCEVVSVIIMLRKLLIFSVGKFPLRKRESWFLSPLSVLSLSPRSSRLTTLDIPGCKLSMSTGELGWGGLHSGNLCWESSWLHQCSCNVHEPLFVMALQSTRLKASHQKPEYIFLYVYEINFVVFQSNEDTEQARDSGMLSPLACLFPELLQLWSCHACCHGRPS